MLSFKKTVAFPFINFSHVRCVFPWDCRSSIHCTPLQPDLVTFSAMVSVAEKAMSWPMALELLSQGGVKLKLRWSLPVNVTISQMNGHVFESVRESLEHFTMQSLSRLILQFFSYTICFENVQPSSWPSSYFACPLADPFPRIPADWSPGQVAFNAALAACGKGWRQGLLILKKMRRPMLRVHVCDFEMPCGPL